MTLADSSRGRRQQRRCREAGVKAVEMVQPWRLRLCAAGAAAACGRSRQPPRPAERCAVVEWNGSRGAVEHAEAVLAGAGNAQAKGARQQMAA